MPEKCRRKLREDFTDKRSRLFAIILFLKPLEGEFIIQDPVVSIQLWVSVSAVTLFVQK